MHAGTDIDAIAKEWGREFTDLEIADDWEKVEDSFGEQSRWCTHWRKVVRHDSGLLIAIFYAKNVGDTESADAYGIQWAEVEETPREVEEYKPVKGGRSGEV